MKGRLKIVPALALLCLVLCCVGASARDWQGSYAQKNRGSGYPAGGHADEAERKQGS